MELKPKMYHKGLSEKNIRIISAIKESLTSEKIVGYNIAAPSVIRKYSSMRFVKKIAKKEKINILLKDTNEASNLFQLYFLNATNVHE